jgi:hypothetical protein
MVEPEGFAQAWMALRKPLFCCENGRHTFTAILISLLKLRECVLVPPPSLRMSLRTTLRTTITLPA